LVVRGAMAASSAPHAPPVRCARRQAERGGQGLFAAVKRGPCCKKTTLKLPDLTRSSCRVIGLGGKPLAKTGFSLISPAVMPHRTFYRPVRSFISKSLGLPAELTFYRELLRIVF
jgi:hypothetical protein